MSTKAIVKSLQKVITQLEKLDTKPCSKANPKSCPKSKKKPSITKVTKKSDLKQFTKEELFAFVEKHKIKVSSITNL